MRLNYIIPELSTSAQSMDNFLDEQIKSYENLLVDKIMREIIIVTVRKSAMTEECFNKFEFVDNNSYMTATGVPNIICLQERFDGMEYKFQELESLVIQIKNHSDGRFDK